MKIVLVNDKFESGGAARVACTMCNELKAHGHDLYVVTNSRKDTLKYALRDDIPLLYADFESRSRSVLSRASSMFRAVKYIRRHLKEVKPDIVIAIQANAYIRSWIANRGLHYSLIVADHTSFARKMDFINTFTRHYLYKYADGISILTNRDARLLREKYPQKMVIHNPLPWPLLAENTKREKTILAAGRFDIWRTKGFDLLLKVWGELAPKHPDWTLEIAGTGTESAIGTVKEMVEQNEVSRQVRLLGHVSDMKTLYGHSGIFALSSRVEGMPMVLLEAMSQGCPCVAFNVGGASSEMLEKGGGIVVEDGDLEGFAKALEILMSEEAMRNEMSEKAVQSASMFSVEVFMEKWNKLIEQTISKK